ncbi:MAG TPA: hypothetical protein VKB15_09090 [Xanthobacteraceae bacterium]|nr:hypothetical protein [Xanthobacteraceae bacterium]
MSKILASVAAFALVAMLALPGPANAAERRADGLRANQAAAPTEFSSRHRRWHRRHIVVRRAYGPRFGYYPYARPLYAGYPYDRSWWGGPYYRPGPAVSFGFGFGPRWGW